MSVLAVRNLLAVCAATGRPNLLKPGRARPMIRLLAVTWTGR